MNIVENAVRVLTPLIASRIAAALGISPALATTAVAALVPAILAALAGKASTPAGASALSQTLGAQDTSVLDQLSGLLEGPGKTDFIQSGTGALSSLLGTTAPAALATAVSKFTGIEPAAASALVGVVAPVVMGSLAQTQRQSGLDARGLAQLLESQKQTIQAALPAGFAGLLGGSGLIDALDTSAKPAPVGPAARPAAPEPQSYGWLPYAIAIAAAVALYVLFAKPSAPPAPAPGEAASTPGASPVATAQAEALKQAKALFSGLTATLGNIKDAPTAQAAVPNLAAAGKAVDSLQSLAALLPPEARAPVTQAAATALPSLLELVTRALAVPGAEATLRPLLDPILARLTTLAKG